MVNIIINVYMGFLALSYNSEYEILGGEVRYGAVILLFRLPKSFPS